MRTFSCHSTLYFARNGGFRRFLSFSRTLYKNKRIPALVVGCYDKGKLTTVGREVDKKCQGKLSQIIETSEFKGKPGSSRVFHGLCDEVPCIVVAGLGKEDAGYEENEGINMKLENIRLGIGAAAKELRNNRIYDAEVDSSLEATAAAEAVTLGSFVFDELKSEKKKRSTFLLLKNEDGESHAMGKNWMRGHVAADCQNFARYLMELPSNYKTPEKLAGIIQQRLAQYEDIEVIIRDKDWIKEKNMGCFLGVAQGSIESPVLMEIKYTNKSSKKTVAVVGKGVTFDTGGISIKPSAKMADMKADMGGAACTVSCVEAACRLGLDVNVIGLVALTENMPSGTAIKPGDVLTAMNGKTVEVDNTDAEGRLILADALVYAHSFKPSSIINIATLTGAISVALGSAASGVFTTSTALWDCLNEASQRTGDRLWRMPLYNHYTEEMKCSATADLRNTQKTAGAAGSCTAAAFLKEFVEIDRWAHIDIAGVMSSSGELPYLPKGMSGRPTRTLIETLDVLSKED
eukprot:gene18066-19875_t